MRFLPWSAYATHFWTQRSGRRSGDRHGMDRSLASFHVSKHILRRGPPHTFLFTSSLLDTEKDPWPIVLACYFPLWHSTRQQTGTIVDSDWMKLAEVHCIGCFSVRPTATSRWRLRASADLCQCCGARCRARCCLNRWACCSDWRAYFKWMGIVTYWFDWVKVPELYCYFSTATNEFSPCFFSSKSCKRCCMLLSTSAD